MKKIILISIIAFFVIIQAIILLSLFGTNRVIDESGNVKYPAQENSGDNLQTKDNQNVNQEINDLKQEQTNPTTTSPNPTQGGGGGSGGGESGITSTSENNLPPTCFIEQITYSAKKIADEKSQDKITCKVEIKNLDNEITGEFSLNLSIKNEENTSNSKIIQKTILPRQTQLFNYTFTSSETLSCFYETIEIPTKEVCY